MKKNTFSKLLSTFLCALLIAAMSICAVGCGAEAPVANEDQTANDVAADENNETVVADDETEVKEDETEVSDDEDADDADADKADDEDADAASDDAEVTELGEGETQFTFEVTDADGNTTTFLINTDETTVGDALLAVNLIAGEDSEYGLYVKTVSGITVDYDTDGKYWAFYIDGEYAMTGVDSTDVTAGSTYAFKVE